MESSGTLKRTNKLRTRYLTSALVVLVMIGYGVVTSALNTRRNLDDSHWVSHSWKVLSALRISLSSMQDLELGQRGYIIVGEEQYLEPYEHSLAALDRSLGELADLTRDNAPQHAKSVLLQEAATKKKAYLARTIEIRRNQGEAEVRRISATGEGKALMDAFRKQISDMEAVEVSLLDVRQQRLVASLSRTNFIVAATGGVAVLSSAIGVLVLFFYLRNQERMEKIQLDKDRAVQADKAKSEFLAMMSHEIRTPMNAILGFGELLEDSLRDDQQKYYAKAILSSGNSLLKLINDILDLSKIEAAKLDLRPAPVAMARFTENLETLFAYRAAEKGVAYRVTVDPRVPDVLVFDALRLRQIMINLIGNALKFTREGQVDVKVEPVRVPDDARQWLRFTVSDTGIGIAREQHEAIFRPFYQVDSRNSRDFQGTGLGLNISERLARMLGGEIRVESELGKGSEFTLRIPVERSEEPVATSETPKEAPDFNQLSPAKILIADDVPLNRELIRGYLGGSHHEIIEAENGEQVVTLCERFTPDLVLMDIRMPVMDGRAARVRLKENDSTRHIPLIAVSASSLLNSQEELKAIFEGYLDKPLNRNSLFAEVSRFLKPLAQPAEVKPAEAAVSPRGDVADPAGLAVALGGLLDSPWPDLVKLAPAQATMSFADRISSLARSHGSFALGDYAIRLRKAAETFDLETANKLLRAFPDVVKSHRPPDA